MIPTFRTFFQHEFASWLRRKSEDLFQESGNVFQTGGKLLAKSAGVCTYMFLIKLMVELH